MPIQRTGNCPAFWEYVVKQVILPHVGPFSEDFEQVTRFGFSWIEVPTYQRGIVWNEDKLVELLDSESALLGNAVLAQFAVPHRAEPPFTNLPESENDYQVLVDGLQRFTMGTALLNILNDLVFAEQPRFPVFKPVFSGLLSNVGGQLIVVQHNDRQLRSHPRTVIRDSYVVFYDRLERWLIGELRNPIAGQERSESILRLFLQRQISPDTYHGFRDEYEVTNTFIGLNTTRVQLHVVDWLRSIIVDLAGRSAWSPEATSQFENQFTDTFYSTNGGAPIAMLEPFAAIVKDALVGNGTADTVFPSLPANLDESEVDAFLRFVRAVWIHIDDELETNPYVLEIFNCGALPFASLLCHYYRLVRDVAGEAPFLHGSTSDDSDLKTFLRGVYRVLLDGRIGRTRAVATQLLQGSTGIAEMGDELSRRFLERGLDSPVSQDWLAIALRRADRRRCQRIFNACLLPVDSEEPFAPHRYGSRTEQFQIDHLIPKSAITKNEPGSVEADSIVNFAPVRCSTNNAQSNLTCASKLAPEGAFERELESSPETSNPYLQWLVDNHGSRGIQNDYPPFLEQNAEIPIGDERLSAISALLSNRL